MKIVKSIINVFTVISAAAIAGLLGITVADVIGRLIFLKPVVGTTEISEVLMAVILTAMAGTLLAKKTVQVDVLMDALPKKISRVIDTVTLAVAAAYCFLVGYATYLSSQSAQRTNRVYGFFLGIPRWPFMMLLALSFVMAGVAAIIFIVTLHQNKEDKKPEKKSLLDDAELTILKEAGDV